MATLQDINKLIDTNHLDEALAAISAEVEPDAQLLFLKGKVLWRMGRRAEAVAAYGASVELNPEGPAKLALEHASEIESFFNPDLLNP